MNTVRIYNLLKTSEFKELTFERFHILGKYQIDLVEAGVVGNILEEWLAKWFDSKGIPNIHNHKQSSPDFWLDPDNLNDDWLEVKSFMGSPSFDLAAYLSFIQLVIDKPWKLQSSYLLIKYKMKEGLVTIEDFWLKKIWEISCPSASWPVKVQYRNKAITNLRPATWYSENTDYPVFKSLEHFLAALEQTIYKYRATNYLAENWKDKVVKSYKDYYGVELDIPRWNDIKKEYMET